eukprot:symbB.v1.2.027380.t1/scaffold2805.1/size71130/7
MCAVQALGSSCTLGQMPSMPCQQMQCFAPELRGTLDMGSAELQRAARGAIRNLCRSGAPATLVALIAAIDSQATFYPSVTTECIHLRATLNIGERCGDFWDTGMSCAHSLFHVGALQGSALKDMDLWQRSFARSDWTFLFASGRISILSGLLKSIREPHQEELWMAEVGVFMANTSVSLLSLFEDLRMLLVDPSQSQALEEFYVSPFSIFTAAMEATQPLRRRATAVLQTSRAAAAWMRPDFLDMVFLDGDHRYESVMDDIKAWWPKLRSGGVLAGHDFAVNFPGVVQAAMDFALSQNLRLFMAPEIWWIFKDRSQIPTSLLAKAKQVGSFPAVPADTGRSFPSSRHPCLLAPTTSIPCRPASEAQGFATTWKVSFLEGRRSHDEMQSSERIESVFPCQYRCRIAHHDITETRGFPSMEPISTPAPRTMTRVRSEEPYSTPVKSFEPRSRELTPTIYGGSLCTKADTSWLRSLEQQVLDRLRKDAYLLSTLKRSMQKDMEEQLQLARRELEVFFARELRAVRDSTTVEVQAIQAEVKTLRRGSNGSDNLAEAVAKLCEELDHVTKESVSQTGLQASMRELRAEVEETLRKHQQGFSEEDRARRDQQFADLQDLKDQLKEAKTQIQDRWEASCANNIVCLKEELEQHRQTVKNEKHVYRHDLKSGLSGINDKVETLRLELDAANEKLGKALREDAKLQSAVRELAVLGNDMAELKRQVKQQSLDLLKRRDEKDDLVEGALGLRLANIEEQADSLR